MSKPDSVKLSMAYEYDRGFQDGQRKIKKLRNKISKDMDTRLPLHSAEWDYAKEMLIFIDSEATPT